MCAVNLVRWSMNHSIVENAQAVVFMKDNKVQREMLFSEFEAVLDSFIPLPELAQSQSTAIYLEINSQLLIEAAVFFRISFDREGFPDKSWNVPLSQLVESAAHGPDLGAGPIKLSCYTQCSLPWLQRSLWDPDMTPGVNNFSALKKVIAKNRLGLTYVPQAPVQPNPIVVQPIQENIPTLNAVDERRYQKSSILEIEDELREKYQKSFRNRLANTLKKQRLQLATLKNRHQQRIDQLNLEHQRRVDLHKSEIESLKTDLAAQERFVSELKLTIDNQSLKMANVREYFEEKLKSVKNVGDEQISILNRHFEVESETKIQAATKDLKEQMQMREIELMYLSEHQKNLADELAQAQRERDKLQEDKSKDVLQDIVDAGISFVAYQTGLGHLNISKDEIAGYMSNPDGFAAQKCGVSLPTYKAWLAHFKTPTCQALQKDGSVCGAPIARITSPLDFHPGESDRCSDHCHNNVIKLSAVNNK